MHTHTCRHACMYPSKIRVQAFPQVQQIRGHTPKIYQRASRGLSPRANKPMTIRGCGFVRWVPGISDGDWDVKTRMVGTVGNSTLIDLRLKSCIPWEGKRGEGFTASVTQGSTGEEVVLIFYMIPCQTLTFSQVSKLFQLLHLTSLF